MASIYPPYQALVTWGEITVTLAIEEITDSFIKAVIPHEFPRIDGPTLEDMGLGVREISFRCYFIDTIDESPFTDQIQLLKALQHLYSYDNPVLFIHPVYGIVKGAIDMIEVKHDATKNMVACDVRFIEDRAPVFSKIPEVENPVVTSTGQITDQIEETMWETIKNTVTDFIDTGKSALGEAWDFVADKTDMVQEAFDEFVEIREDIKSVFYQLDYYYRQLRDQSYGNIEDVIDTYEDFNNLVNLPDTVAKKIARATTLNYAGISNSLIKTTPTPVRYITQYNRIATATRTKTILDPQGDEVKEKVNKAIMQMDNAIKTSFLAKEVSRLYAQDEIKRNIFKVKENVPQWNVIGKYKKSKNPSILTLQEIEQSLYSVRAQIQQLIDETRAEEVIYIIGSEMVTPFTTGESVYFQTSKAKGVFLSLSKDLPQWLPHEILWDTDILDSTDWYQIQLDDGRPENGETVIGLQSGETMTIEEVYGGSLPSNKTSVNNLTDLALKLQEQAIHIKIESERVVTRNISIPTPLVRICTNNGLSYEYITRVAAINQDIWNPNFAQGSVNIYAKQR